MFVFDRIIQLLDENKIKYKILEHERVHTCEDAAKIRGTSPDQGAKALVCMADGSPVLIVLPCSSRLDFKAFKKFTATLRSGNVVNVKDLRMATPEEVKEITGLEVGSIPPIGSVLGKGLPTHVDGELLKQKEICFNAGLHDKSILMRSEDYVRVAGPSIGNFVKS